MKPLFKGIFLVPNLQETRFGFDFFYKPNMPHNFHHFSRASQIKRFAFANTGNPYFALTLNEKILLANYFDCYYTEQKEKKKNVKF